MQLTSNVPKDSSYATAGFVRWWRESILEVQSNWSSCWPKDGCSATSLGSVIINAKKSLVDLYFEPTSAARFALHSPRCSWSCLSIRRKPFTTHRHLPHHSPAGQSSSIRLCRSHHRRSWSVVSCRAQNRFRNRRANRKSAATVATFCHNRSIFPGSTVRDGASCPYGWTDTPHGIPRGSKVVSDGSK